MANWDNESNSLLDSVDVSDSISWQKEVKNICISAVISLWIGLMLRIVIDGGSRAEPKWCLLRDESTGLSPSDLAISIFAMLTWTINARGRRTSRCAALFPRKDFYSCGLSMLLGFTAFFFLKEEMSRDDDIVLCNSFEKCASTLNQRWMSLSDGLALGVQYLSAIISKRLIYSIDNCRQSIYIERSGFYSDSNNSEMVKDVIHSNPSTINDGASI